MNMRVVLKPSLIDMSAWLKTQDPATPYNWVDGGTCAFAAYAKHLGYGFDGFGGLGGVLADIWGGLSDQYFELGIGACLSEIGGTIDQHLTGKFSHLWTYGQLAQRIDAALAAEAKIAA